MRRSRASGKRPPAAPASPARRCSAALALSAPLQPGGGAWGVDQVVERCFGFARSAPEALSQWHGAGIAVLRHADRGGVDHQVACCDHVRKIRMGPNRAEGPGELPPGSDPPQTVEGSWFAARSRVIAARWRRLQACHHRPGRPTAADHHRPAIPSSRCGSSRGARKPFHIRVAACPAASAVRGSGCSRPLDGMPVGSASGTGEATDCLCGMVTLRPRQPTARSPSSTSRRWCCSQGRAR